MAVVAVQHIRRMRGGAQGQLMLGADGHVYVVKFQNNPQHVRVLANELLASRLAVAAGLTAPQAELVEVSSWLVENTPELEMDLGRTRERCTPGLQFGSRFVGGLMPGQVVDYLPEEQLGEVKNVEEFAGILALDKWTGTRTGGRRCSRASRGSGGTGRCSSTMDTAFTRGSGGLRTRRCAGCTTGTTCIGRIAGWESFEPWLSRLETMPAETVWSAANEVPPEWYGGDMAEMEALVEKLLAAAGQDTGID